MQGRMAPMQQQCFPLASNARRLASDRRNDDEQGGAHAALDRANGVDPYDLASELLWRQRSTGARQPSPHRSAADRYAAVQPVMPRVSHQAAIDEPALRSAALAELGRGSAEVMREVISNGTPRMPGFKYHLQSAEIEAIVAYLKTLPVPPPAASPAASR